MPGTLFMQGLCPPGGWGAQGEGMRKTEGATGGGGQAVRTTPEEGLTGTHRRRCFEGRAEWTRLSKLGGGQVLPLHLPQANESRLAAERPQPAPWGRWPCPARPRS